MIQLSEMLRVILYEGNQNEKSMTPYERASLLQILLEDGCHVTYMGMDQEVEIEAEGHYLVLGQFKNNIPSWKETNNTRFLFRSLDDCSPESVHTILNEAREEMGISPREPWKPWFPAIDMERCTNCLQCLSFCLFDVYSVEEGKIKVQNPTNCKTDCPACSRVCPEVAIIFPKYRSGPINGDKVKQEDLNREKMKVDISALLGGDIYQKLRSRTEHARTRFSKERSEDRALKERQRCMEKLKKEFDIPEELLNSLPSDNDIQAKLKELQNKSTNVPS